MSKKNPDNLEKLFRDTIRNGAGNTGWDRPDPGVWDRIDTRINEEKRRRPLFWLFPAIGLIGLVTAGLWFTSSQDEKNTNSPSATPAENTVLALGQNAPDSEDPTTESYELPRSGIDPDPENPKPGMINQGAVVQAEPESGKLRQFPASPETARVDRANGNSTTNWKTTAMPAIEDKNAVLAFPDALGGTQQVPGDNPDTEGVIASLASTRNVDEINTTGKETTRQASALPFILHGQLDELEVPERKYSMEFPVSAWLEGWKMEEANRMPFSLEFHIGPEWASSNLRPASHQPDVLKRVIENQERSRTGLHLGLEARLDLSERVFLTSGLAFQQKQTALNRFHQLRYTQDGEVQTPDQTFRRDYLTDFATSFGRVSTEMIVERSSDKTISENSFINLHLQARHTITSLRIPVLAGVRLGNGRLVGEAAVGLGIEKILDQQLDLKGIAVSDAGIQRVRAKRNIALKGYNSTDLDAMLRLGMIYRLSKQFSLTASGNAAYSLTPVYKTPEIRSYPYDLWMQFGIRHTFHY